MAAIAAILNKAILLDCQTAQAEFCFKWTSGWFKIIQRHAIWLIWRPSWKKKFEYVSRTASHVKMLFFVWFDYLRPINNLSVKQGQVFLGGLNQY